MAVIGFHTFLQSILWNAFNQAVKWELMPRNPVEHATLPKEEHTPRDIWTAEVLFKALDACEDDNLLLAMNLAFSCTLRMGELLGLTWNCVDISQTSIDASGEDTSDAALLMRLLQKPEMAQLLKTLAQSL